LSNESINGDELGDTFSCTGAVDGKVKAHYLGAEDDGAEG
jgi:hypothetical protein